MTTYKRSYFLNTKRCDLIEEVYPQKIVGVFKNETSLEVIDGILNADLISEEDAYYISLEKMNNTPKDIFRCDQDCELQKIKHEEHNICFHGRSESYHGLFISKVFAESEEQALRKSIRIRNETILSGEWNLAWERHKRLQRP